MNERIRKLRVELHLTQQQFANQISITRGSLGNIETGKKTPSDLIINAICREFGVSKKWLCSGEGNMFISEPNTEVAEKFRKKLISKISKLSDAQLIMLAEMAEDFCKETESDN